MRYQYKSERKSNQTKIKIPDLLCGLHFWQEFFWPLNCFFPFPFRIFNDFLALIFPGVELWDSKKNFFTPCHFLYHYDHYLSIQLAHFPLQAFCEFGVTSRDYAKLCRIYVDVTNFHFWDFCD